MLSCHDVAVTSSTKDSVESLEHNKIIMIKFQSITYASIANALGGACTCTMNLHTFTLTSYVPD